MAAPAGKASKAEAARLEGNNAMRQRNYAAAFDCYTIALQSMPRDHLVLGNRSQAALKLGHFQLALQDAEAAILCGPKNWHKGYYRKGMAEFETQNFAEARNSFALAGERAPDETIQQECISFCKRADEGLKAQVAADGRYAPAGSALGCMLALVLVASESSTFADLNSARNRGSAKAVGGTVAMFTMAVPLLVGAVVVCGGLGYAYSLYLQSTRHAKLHTATAVVQGGPPSVEAAAASTPTAGPAATAGPAGSPSRGQGDKPKAKVRKRSTVREAAMKAKGVSK